MGQDAQPTRSYRPAWFNQVPAWIRNDEPYLDLVKSIRRTHQAIANRCNAPDAAGNLVGCFGGKSLAADAGCSIRSLWNHVKRLEALGFLVTVGIGGTIGPRNYGNTYAIPGQRGGLDERRAHRRMQRMIEGLDGVWRPEAIENGDQATLWGFEGVEKLHGGSKKLHGGVVQELANLHGGVVQETPNSCTPPSLLEDDPSKNHEGESLKDAAVPASNLPGSGKPDRSGIEGNRPDGGGDDHTEPGTGPNSRSNANRMPARKPDGPCMTRVTKEDLSSAANLSDLFFDACRRKLITDTDRDRFAFHSAAQHALRVGANPGALFATIIRKKLWAHITAGDESAALERLKHRRKEAPNSVRPEWRKLSSDALLAVACLKVRRDDDKRAYRLARTRDPELNLERWAAALIELKPN